MKEDYPGQAYFHRWNKNLRQAEENWKLKHEEVSKEVRYRDNYSGTRKVTSSKVSGVL